MDIAYRWVALSAVAGALVLLVSFVPMGAHAVRRMVQANVPAALCAHPERNAQRPGPAFQRQAPIVEMAQPAPPGQPACPLGAAPDQENFCAKPGHNAVPASNAH